MTTPETTTTTTTTNNNNNNNKYATEEVIIIGSGRELLDRLLFGVGNNDNNENVNVSSSSSSKPPTPTPPMPPTTCHSLLRRNKAMPCQHVKDVMGVLTTMSSETIRIRGSGDVPPPSLSTLLCQAHEILLSECTEIGRKERTTNNNIQQSFTTTTGCHDNVRTTTTTSTTLRAIDTSTRLFRYFQLLLSIVDVSSSNKTSTTNSTTTTTTSSTNNNNNNINVGEEIIITGRQVEIWIANLLKPFIEAICRWIEERVGVGGTKDNNNNNNNNNDDGMLDTTMTTKSEGGGITPTSQAAGRDDDDDEDDDDDDPLMNDLHHQKQQSCSDHDDDVRPVVVFVWRMMIRFNQTYAAQVLGLLAPVWKNMTDLVSSIVRCQHQRIEANAAAAANATTKNEVDIWRSDCFESLFEDTLENIHELTHDGKVRLERLAIEHLAVTASTKQDSSIVSTAETKQYLRHVKIMGFAAHKLCQLVKDYLAFVDNKRSSLSTSASTSTSKPNKPRLFMDVWRTLFGLRGMAAVFQELYLMDKSDKNDKDRLICKIFCQVAAKAGDAIDNINVSQQDLLINIPAIEMILQESASSDNDAEEDDDNTTIQAGAKVSKDRKIMSRFILRSSRDIGRLMTLQRVLTVSETNSHENIEPLIAIVENMFSASVPRCLSICLLATEAKHRNVPSATTPFDGALTSALVLNSLTLMTRVITAINRTLASSSSSDDNNSSTSLCNNRQASYHRLLLGWLSLNNAQAQQPRQQNREKAHPLAREMIVLLLHKVILNLSFTSGQQGSAVRLLSYLVKIMFDERSSSVLRRNVSSILILLQKQSESSSDSASSSFGPFDISDITRFMLEKELECQWKKEDTSKGKKSTKKRKREANGAPISFYGSDNLLLLSQVFSQSAMSTSNDSIDLVAKLPSITKCIEQLYQNASKVTSSDSHNYVVLQSSIERNVISMAFLERLCRCDDVTENYQLPSGKIFDMICSIIRAVVKVEVHEEDNQSKVGNTVQLYRSALGLATTACIRFSNAEDIGRLFTCTRKLFSTVVSFVTSIRKDVSSVESKQIAALLSAESYALFGRLGRVVPNDCSSRHLEKLHQCSSQLSSVEDWAILTHGFTSVAAFGSTVCPEHYHILPKCLPESEEIQNLFTSNFSATKATASRRCDRAAICKKLCSMARQLNPRIVPIERKIGQQSIFPSVSVLQIDPGSYILDMRNISGNLCYVIYPPGEESLVALRDVVSKGQQEISESDNGPTIQTLSRAIPLATGGFKCLLQSQNTL